MKHPQGNRRPRRPNGGRRGPQNIRSQNFESNGPEGRIRGTAQQVLEKYLTLGRDATSAGGHIQAEAFFQHAEHYFRLLNSDPNYQNRQGEERRPTPADSDPDSFSQDDSDDDRGGRGRGEPAGMGEQPGMPEQSTAPEKPQTPPEERTQAPAVRTQAPPAERPQAPAAGHSGQREIPISQGEQAAKNPSAGESGEAPRRRRGRPPKAAAEAPAE